MNPRISYSEWLRAKRNSVSVHVTLCNHRGEIVPEEEFRTLINTGYRTAYMFHEGIHYNLFMANPPEQSVEINPGDTPCLTP